MIRITLPKTLNSALPGNPLPSRPPARGRGGDQLFAPRTSRYAYGAISGAYDNWQRSVFPGAIRISTLDNADGSLDRVSLAIATSVAVFSRSLLECSRACALAGAGSRFLSAARKSENLIGGRRIAPASRRGREDLRPFDFCVPMSEARNNWRSGLITGDMSSNDRDQDIMPCPEPSRAEGRRFFHVGSRTVVGLFNRSASPSDRAVSRA